ncbi:MAG: hypothetical protein F6K40_26695 [Okeania sp. SIO3I5]|uniref:hypothetical protein n=1 Tax=Okeania sp. SIO3I5 TaxID=2607805 RepID=UPI0013BCA96A|nr:hypothetical protein [Okeania sp. SIO3I5]NEQ39649.1 hypothetical protein [Okeania sp. SIO3I5]
MMNQKLIVPEMALIRSESVQAIIDRLGIAKAAFFCRETMSQSVDYLELKETMFGKKSAREIYEEIKNNP